MFIKSAVPIVLRGVASTREDKEKDKKECGQIKNMERK